MRWETSVGCGKLDPIQVYATAVPYTTATVAAALERAIIASEEEAAAAIPAKAFCKQHLQQLQLHS